MFLRLHVFRGSILPRSILLGRLQSRYRAERYLQVCPRLDEFHKCRVRHEQHVEGHTYLSSCRRTSEYDYEQDAPHGYAGDQEVEDDIQPPLQTQEEVKRLLGPVHTLDVLFGNVFPPIEGSYG